MATTYVHIYIELALWRVVLVDAPLLHPSRNAPRTSYKVSPNKMAF